MFLKLYCIKWMKREFVYKIFKKYINPSLRFVAKKKLILKLFKLTYFLLVSISYWTNNPVVNVPIIKNNTIACPTAKFILHKNQYNCHEVFHISLFFIFISHISKGYDVISFFSLNPIHLFISYNLFINNFLFFLNLLTWLLMTRNTLNY